MAGSHSLGTIRGTIEIDYDGAGIVKAVRDVDKVKSSSDKAGPSIARFASILGTLSKIGVVTAASSLALNGAVQVLAATLAAIGPVAAAGIATLPGLLVTLASANLVLKASLAGMSDAFEAAFDEADKFQEAIKDLPPNAKAAAVAFRGVVESLTPVQRAIQNTFFTGVGERITAVGKSVAGLRDDAVGVAGGFNRVLTEVLRFAESSTFINLMRSSLTSVRTVLDGLYARVQPLLGAFADLAIQASGFGGAISERINPAIDKLTAFIRNVDIAALFETARPIIDTVKTLFADLRTIASGLFTLLRVDGADALGVIGQLVGRLADFIESAEGQQTLVALGQALGAIGGALGQAFLALLQAVAPILIALAPVVQQVATVVGGLLTNAFRALSPILTTIAQAIGGVLGPVLAVLARHFQAMLPVVNQVVEALGPFLSGVLTALAPVLGQIASSLSSALIPAFQQLVPALLPLLPALAQMAQELLPQLVPLIQSLTDAFIALLPALIPVIENGVAVLVKLLPTLTFLLGATAGGGAKMIGFLTAVVGPIASFVGWLLRASSSVAKFATAGSTISAVWSAIKLVFFSGVATITALWNNFWAVVRTVATGVIRDVQNRVRAGIAAVTGAFRAISAIIGIVRGAFNSARNAVSSGINSIVSLVRGLPGRVSGALGSLGGLLYSKGQSLVEGFIRGIRSMIGRVKDAARSVVDAVTGFLPGSPAKEGPLSGRGYVLLRARRFMADFARGIDQAAQIPVEATLGAVTRVSGVVPENVSTGVTGASTGRSTPRDDDGEFGPYQLIIDGRLMAEFVVDTLTGQPKVVSKAAREGDRQNGWTNPGRAA